MTLTEFLNKAEDYLKSKLPDVPEHTVHEAAAYLTNLATIAMNDEIYKVREQFVDEIKRELDNPIHVHYHISDIEPRMTPLALHDLEFLHTDALALIQQLESENAEKDARIQQLEAERDAAVKDIRLSVTLYVGGCRTCDENYSNLEWRGVQKEETT